MFKPESFLESKSTVFGIVLAAIIAILAVPVIIPHATHGPHMVHIALHIGGIILAVFITILAVLAFYRIKTKRMLITSIAFSLFVAAEFVFVIDATWPTVFDFSKFTLNEIGHALTISTLGLLAIGVFRND